MSGDFLVIVIAGSVIGFVALALIGCAPNPGQDWTQTGATEAHARRDYAACQIQAERSAMPPPVRHDSYRQYDNADPWGEAGHGFGEGLAHGLQVKRLTGLCMEAWGYE